MTTLRWHEALGLSWPLIQAPMAGVQDHRLAIAAAKAGALGSIPAAMITAQALRDQLQALADAGVAAVNVNFFCHRPVPPDAQRHAAWLGRLEPYYRELGLDASTVIAGGSRQPFGPDTLAVIQDFRPRVVSFHFGLPEPALLDAVKRRGAMVLSSATTVDEARWLEAHGADVVIAQGLEAGGHRGVFLGEGDGGAWTGVDTLASQGSTFALVPAIVDAVKLPVIAAGGIADARGVAAAMALGAAGVQVGTAFLLTPEATTSAVHRAALQSEGAAVTALTNLFTGRPARGIVNRVMRELGPICGDAPPFAQATAALAPLRAAAEARGDGGFSPLWSGQRGSPYRGGESAGEIVRRLARGFAVVGSR
jgi:nitronate monooxygenase